MTRISATSNKLPTEGDPPDSYFNHAVAGLLIPFGVFYTYARPEEAIGYVITLGGAYCLGLACTTTEKVSQVAPLSIGDVLNQL